MWDIPRMLSNQMLASMGFRRADWPEREAERTSVRELRLMAKVPHKTLRSGGGERRSPERRSPKLWYASQRLSLKFAARLLHSVGH